MNINFSKDKIIEFISKNRKKIFIYTPLSFLGAFIISLIFWFGPTVGFILTIALKPAFSIGEIYFPQKGEVLAKNVKLSYKGQLIVDAPKVILKYDLNGQVRDWMRAIDVYDSKIVIDRNGSNVNIVDAFSTGSPGKAGLGVPIAIIRAINAEATYRDFSYGAPIVKDVPVVNGYVSFDKNKGIDLIFGGPLKDGEISYSFTNYTEAYSMTIKGKNLDLDTNILQYAYYYEDVNYLSGKADLDLTVAASGLYGTADIRNMEVQYKPFAETAKKINGHVDFLKDKIKIDADFNIFNKTKKFILDFDSKTEMNINIILGNMKYEEISKYKLLTGLDLSWMFQDIKDLNINLKLDKNKDFFVILDSVIPKVSLGATLENVKNRLVYSNGVMNWTILNSDLSLGYLKDNFTANFRLEEEKGNLTYKLNSIEGDIDLGFYKNKIGINSKSGFVVGKGDYIYESRILNLYNIVNHEKLYNVVYDFKDYNLSEFTGGMDFNLTNSLNGQIKGDIRDGSGKIENITLYDIDNKEVFTAQGDVNLKELEYNFYFDTNTLEVSEDIFEKELKIAANISGIVSGKGEKYNLEIDGELVTLDYENIHLNGLKSNFRIKNGIIDIKKLGNNIVNLKGNIDLVKKVLNLEYDIKNLTNEYIKIEKPNIIINDSVGKIKGELNNPEISFLIKKGVVFLEEKEGLNFTGDLLYKNKILKLNELTFEDKKSILQGEYNLANDKYKFSGQILLDRLSKYTGIRYFNYRVIGSFFGEGVGKEIKIKTQYTVDSIYYKGEKLPDLEGKMFYNAKNLTDGILDIKYLKILKNNKQLGFLDGKIDFETKELGIYLNEGEVDLSNYFMDPNIRGIVHLNGDVEGSLDAPQFKFKAYSKEIGKENWDLKEVNLSVSGNLNEIKVEKFSILYEKNLLEAYGNYFFNTKEYSINLFSKNIEVDFLNGLLNKNGVENLKGNAELDLKFTDKGNSGFFRGNGLNFKIPKYMVEGENIDFNFDLSGDKLEIKKLNGVLNSGEVEATGYLIIPKIDEIKSNPYFYEKINYDLSLNTQGIKYEYPEHIKLIFDTDLNISSNKLVGTFIVREGELTKIPGISEDMNILKIIATYLKEFIFRTKTASKSKKESTEDSTGEFGKLLETNLEFKIEKGIDINLKSIVGIVDDIKGKFLGSGQVKGKDGKVNFIGSFSIENGQYMLNSIDFKITEAKLIFNKDDEYYPNYNPILIFESNSKDLYENYEISLNGELKKLNYTIKSNQGTSSGNLSSLFSNNKKQNRSQEGGNDSFVVGNVLGGQLTNNFLKPFSNTIKTVFGLSKLRITSDIENSSAGTVNLNNNTGNDYGAENQYKLGAKLQAEKHLYRKFYLVGEAGLAGNNSNSTRGNDESGNSFDKYNGGLEYRINDSKSVELGVSKIVQDNSETVDSNQKKDTEKLNYYIEFLFYKKYESFSDMIKNIF